MKERINTGLVAALVIYTIVMGLLIHHYWKEEQAILEKFEQRQEQWNEYWKEYWRSRDTLDTWTTLQMAIVMTESKFNPEAVGKDKDYGIFQQVPIYVEECNRILSLRGEEIRYVHEDSFDIQKSIEMFNLLQSHYNPERDTAKALRYQNRADWYARRVRENLVFIQQMEEVRKALRDSQGVL